MVDSRPQKLQKNQTLVKKGKYMDDPECHAWLIGNRGYQNVRDYYKEAAAKATDASQKQKYAHMAEAFVDVSQAYDDVANMEKFCNTMGWNVVKSMDADKTDLMNQLCMYMSMLNNAKKKQPNKKFLLFAYYSGHGCMDTQTMCMTNEKTDQPHFKMEASLANLSGYPNACIIGVFDCCRQNVQGMRGIGEDVEHTHQNLQLIFGCKPSAGVSLKSDISTAYCKMIKDHIEENGGIMQVPDYTRDLSDYLPHAEERKKTSNIVWMDYSRVLNALMGQSAPTPAPKQAAKPAPVAARPPPQSKPAQPVRQGSAVYRPRPSSAISMVAGSADCSGEEME